MYFLSTNILDIISVNTTQHLYNFLHFQSHNTNCWNKGNNLSVILVAYLRVTPPQFCNPSNFVIGLLAPKSF